MGYHIGEKGLSLIKSFEGCYAIRKDGKVEAYLDPVGTITIGWGTTRADLPDLTKNTVMTREEVDKLFEKSLLKYEAYVEEIALSKFPKLNQNQLDALTSYCYNRGPGGLRQLITNSQSISSIADNIIVYWGSAQNVKNGLVRRRKAERELFLTPVTPKEDKELAQAVSKIILSGVPINFNQWKRMDLMKMANVPALLSKLGGLEILIKRGIIANHYLWENGIYRPVDVRTLLIKYSWTLN